MNSTVVKWLMPLKVQYKAKELGVHEECIESDLMGSCVECIDLMNEAFDHYYSHAENSDDALMMILSDILEDTEALP